MKIHHALSVLVCSLFTTFFYAADETKQSPHVRAVASRLLVIETHLRIPSYNSMTDLTVEESPRTPAESESSSLKIFDHGTGSPYVPSPKKAHGTGSPITPKKSVVHGTGSPIKRVCSSGSVDRLA